MDPGVVLFAIGLTIGLVRWWVGNQSIRAAKRAVRMAKSSERTSLASIRLAETSTAFSAVASEATFRARLADYHFGHWFWSICAKFFFYCSQWYLGRSMQLLNRGIARLQKCN